MIDRLKKSTKPSTLAKLESSIRSYFSPPLDQKALAAVLQSLKDKKKIAVDGTKVVYSLG